jgi:rhodanese-related sulfurtransferase
MPTTFGQMVAQARAEVPVVSPAEAKRRLAADSKILIVDVRDAADIPVTGIIAGAINVSLGTLTYKADHEVPPDWRDPHFADQTRPIITTCELGPMGALGGKLLQDLGYTNVAILDGGVQGWKDAGYATEPVGGA